MALLITTEDLATLLQDTVDESHASLACALASGIVSGYTGQTIALTVHTHTLPVTQGGVVVLPQRPVRAVDTVTVDGVDLAADAWTWDGMSPQVIIPALAYRRRVALGTVAYIPQLTSTDVTATVEYTAGYAEVPDDVRAVALGQAAAIVRNPDGLSSESVADYSRSWDRAAGALNGAEKAILDTYRRNVGSIRPS